MRLAVAALALALAAGAARSAQTANAPGAIVFSSTRAANLWGEIYLVRGGHTRNLTHSPADDRFLALSPDGATVAFVSDRGGRQDAVWTMTTTGRRLRRVTPRHPHISALRWTRAGLQFVAGPQNQRGALYAADVATGHERLVARHEDAASFPARGVIGGTPEYCDAFQAKLVLPHGGGTMIVRTHAGMSDANLWTIDPAAGAHPLPLVTSDPLRWETEARWSPDGGRVAYVADMILSDGGQPCGPLQGPLSTVNADGSNAETLTGFAEPGDTGPVWSPDGTRIAFAHDLISIPDPRNGMFTIDATGGPPHRVTPVEHNKARDNTVWRPSWSPDGARIVYSEGAFASSDMRVVAGTGGPVSRLPHGGSAAAWSPDGRRIAYSHVTTRTPGAYPAAYDLRVVPAAGGPERIISSAGGPEAPVWSPDGKRVAVAGAKGVVVGTGQSRSGRIIVHRPAEHVAWSPDGKRLVFALWDGGRGLFQQRDTVGCCTTDLYVVNADGTGLRRLTHDRALITSVDWRR